PAVISTSCIPASLQVHRPITLSWLIIRLLNQDRPLDSNTCAKESGPTKRSTSLRLIAWKSQPCGLSCSEDPRPCSGSYACLYIHITLDSFRQRSRVNEWRSLSSKWSRTQLMSKIALAQNVLSRVTQ